LRLRKALTIYAGVVGAVFFLILIPTHWPNATVHNDTNGSVPLSILLLVGFCAIIFGTAVSTSLNRENDGVEMVWTKPIARDRLAMRYIALDLAAIAVAFVVALVLAVLVFASFGMLGAIRADEGWFSTALLIFGVAFMWYGILQALTSWQTGRGAIVIGLSWATFAIVLPAFLALTAHIPGLHEIAVALNFLNPLSYLSTNNGTIHIGLSTGGSSLIPHDTWLRVAITWAFGLLGSVAAIAGWKRLEV